MSVGFFGKLPASGDFVSRGLGPGLRPVLDRWVTQNLVSPLHKPDNWPEGGMRAVIQGPKSSLLLLILPSHDKIGRAFPLAVCCAVEQVDRASADQWADLAAPIALDAISHRSLPDALLDKLASLPNPPHSKASNIAPPLLWSKAEVS